MFAKLFGSATDQVLVKIDTNDNCAPEVRFYCEPEGLGVCSTAVLFKENEEGWNRAEKLFGDCTEETARRMVQPIFDAIPESD